MKKFVLMTEYLEHTVLGYINHKRVPVGVANDLNTLMKSVHNLAMKKLQVKNPNFLEIGKWEVNTDGSHAEIIVSDTTDENEDALRFIIDEVDFLFS